MRFLIPTLLLLLGLGGGVGAGLFLATPQGSESAPSDIEAATPAEDHGDEPNDDHADAGDGGGSTEFVRLNNQFIVPIVEQGFVRSLVVMTLTLEVDAGQNTAVFDREPRIRDAFLRAMFAHANVGGFSGYFTESAALDPLRRALGEAATGILGAIVHDVLIVDITRQDA